MDTTALTNTVTALAPHLCLAGGGLVVLLVATLFRSPPRGLLLLISLAAAAGCLYVSLSPPPQAGPVPGLMLETGGLARFFAALLAAAALLALLLAHRYAGERGFGGDALYGLILWSGLGMLLTASATNWLLLLIGLELASLCLYTLIAARLDDPLGTEAALKYFLPGAAALAMLLFGIALIYAGAGTMDIAASLAKPSWTARMGAALALIGIGFKLSLAPVHLWTPDVYQGAPAPVAAFLSTGSKAAVAAALLRLAATAGPEASAALAPILYAAAALTMAAGNIGALCQRSVKRIIAFSSIGQMGYVVMAALAAMTVGGSGVGAAAFYLAAYVVMDLGAFGAIGLVSGTEGDRDDLAAYAGLGYRAPWRAGLLAVCLASLAGLPPLAGFTGKFVVFSAVLQAGITRLAVFGMLMAVVALYYYLKVIAALYMRAEEVPAAPERTGMLAGLAGLAMMALLLGLGIFPSSLLDWIAGVLRG